MHRHRPRLRMTVAIIAAVVMAFGAASASAYYSATATVPGISIRSDQVVSQADPTCTNDGGLLSVLGHADVTWQHVDTRYEYVYEVVEVSDGSVRASGVFTPTGSEVGADLTLEISNSLLSLGIGNTDFDVIVTARLSASPAWTAPTSTTTPVHSVQLLVGLNVQCGYA